MVPSMMLMIDVDEVDDEGDEVDDEVDDVVDDVDEVDVEICR
jgi:hypothetical protein